MKQANQHAQEPNKSAKKQAKTKTIKLTHQPSNIKLDQRNNKQTSQTTNQPNNNTAEKSMKPRKQTTLQQVTK